MAASPDPTKIWMIVLAVIILVVVAILVARKRSKGVYFGQGEQALMLEPAGSPPHTHMATSPAAPMEISTESAGHRHLVADGKDTGLAVTPAGHTHDITKYICQKA